MSVLVTIGDFSRMTYLSVKTLRHYHEIGLLEPVSVDRSSGYRLYDASQVATGQVIRRLRQLDMPLDDVRSVLHAEDLAARNAVIVTHLERMQRQLAATQDTITTLKALLAGPRPELGVVYRTEPPFWALVLNADATVDGPSDWFDELFGQLRSVVGDDQHAAPTARCTTRTSSRPRPGASKCSCPSGVR